MGRIQATFEAIRDDLIADPAAVFVDPDGTPVSLAVGTVLLGGEHVHQNAAFPRVVFVPIAGPIAMSDRSSYSPNHLHTWSLSYDVYCWGADFDGAVDVMQAVVRSTRRNAVGSYELSRAEFLASNTEQLAFGRTLRFPVTIRHPIVDAPATTTDIDAIPQTPQFATL